MSNIIPFDFESHAVRCLWQGDQPWFVAVDVCAVLEHSDPSKAVSRLDDDEKGTNIVRTPSGDQSMLVINESGLYSLILTSRKAAAKRLKKWVTAEVLPALRKTGQYSMAPGEVPHDEELSKSHAELREKYIRLLEEKANRDRSSFENSVYWRLSDALLDHTSLSDNEIASYISDVTAKMIPFEAIAFKRRERAEQSR
jgi:prophage antirepressor-like protein